MIPDHGNKPSCTDNIANAAVTASGVQITPSSSNDNGKDSAIIQSFLMSFFVYPPREEMVAQDDLRLQSYLLIRRNPLAPYLGSRMRAHSSERLAKRGN